MANHGSKFVSVNLNKSYGQQHQPSRHTHFSHFGGGGGSHGQAAAAGRSRGGGGGMVVLSRSRGAPPKVSKLSVPPPLNLPSMRKEHEKFDVPGPGGTVAGSGSGTGSRPNSSGVGWTKPVAAALPEKKESDASVVGGTDVIDGPSRGIGSYMPPSARSNGVGVGGSASTFRASPPSAEKATVLRGEDFPSLQAARPVSSGGSQKPKDGLNQKQKLVVGDELSQDERDIYHLGSLVDMHTLGLSSRNYGGNGLGKNGGRGHRMGNGPKVDQIQKQEEKYPDPLLLINTNPRSDWADDERDTGHGLAERGRDIGFSNPENHWDRDFDLPRPSVLPHKSAQNQYDRWSLRDNETGKNFSNEVLKGDPYNKDVRAPSREGNKWRSSTFSKDGFSSHEVGNRSVDFNARMPGHNNMMKENKYISPRSGDGRDGCITLKRDSAFERKDLSLEGRQQQRNFSVESCNNSGAERWDRHVTEQRNKYRVDDIQNNKLSKCSVAPSGKLPPITDPVLTIGREKQFSKSDRSFLEDPFLRDLGSAGFDVRDIFSQGFAGAIKRKKEATRPTEFHDPVRESFEAELERVQKMQELERQRIIEEQERALEQARREEEERQKRIREEEEVRRRHEEEAREAAWRAEQERLEAIRKAEEQRINREEEKRRIQEEEERRKQAAKQKLQELEAKMAKREAEVAKIDGSVSKTFVDEKLEVAIQEKNISRNLDSDTWEDDQRIVEDMTTSGLFDSLSHSRHVEMRLGPFPSGDSPSNLIERGKAVYSWRRDLSESGGTFPPPLPGQEIGHYSPRRDAFAGGRAAPWKEFHGGGMPSRAYLKAGMQEPYLDEFEYQKDNRWNLSGNGNSYGKFREMESELPDCIVGKYGDSGRGQGQSRGDTHPPYPEHLYPYSEASELYSYGRSRYSMRQPRVLPPPLASSQRSNFIGVTERADPSSCLDNSNHYTHSARIKSTKQTDYLSINHGGLEPSEVFGPLQENTISEEQKLNNTPRCESQSSVSVSSPPTSPPHLSHDELDESGDSPVTSAVAEGRRSFLAGSGSAVHNGNSVNSTIVITSDSVSAVEDEEWTLENDGRMQHQEEYDEDENGCRGEDDVRDRDEENLELNQKLEGLDLQEREPPDMMDNVVLGFDEGVQVVLPSDDFEKDLLPQERSYGVPASSVGIMEEEGSVDGFPSDEQCNLPADNYHGTIADSSSTKVPEKSALRGSVGRAVGAFYPSATADLLDGAESFDTTSLVAQQTVSSSTAAASPTNIPSLSSGSQGDTPVTLQFGLFSGPSLIPSPVPAIQIGSIEMPLHIHPPVGPSIAQMHSSPPPIFQFGQFHYTCPISQELLPTPPQSVSFVQPNVVGHFSLNQNARGSVNHELTRDASSHNITKDEAPLLLKNKTPNLVSSLPEQSNGSISLDLNMVADADSHEENTIVCSSSSGFTGAADKKIKSESSTPVEEKGNHHAAKSYQTFTKARQSQNRSQHVHVQPTMQSVAGEKNFSELRGEGLLSGHRGKRFAYAVKNANTRSSFEGHDIPADSNGIQTRPRRTVQQTEFRIRENDRKSASLLVPFNNAGSDDKSNHMGKAVGGSKRGTISSRTIKRRIESEPPASGNTSSHEVSHGDRVFKRLEKKLPIKSGNTSHSGEASLRRTASEEDVNTPLQSGVVRVFKQPGIEAASDEDDFIEVRSKRQMLSDRREQKEKEIKEKSQTIKPLHKPRATRQKGVVSRSRNKASIPSSFEESGKSQLNFTACESPHFPNNEVSTGFISKFSQPQIGNSAINSESQAIKPHQAGFVSIVSNGKTEHDPILIFNGKNKVMPLNQTQIVEAMKPVQNGSPFSAVGRYPSSLGDPTLTTSSILTKDKSFSSGASPINSLLAGEKIQFGAVTSPTALPISNSTSHGIGAPGSKLADMHLNNNFLIMDKDNSLFFKTEKHLSESHVPLQDCEAEAAAAASAVAVAAIGSNEIVGNGLGSVNDTKSFGGTKIDGVAPGVVGDQHVTNQSQGEELLSVSLPADLSVETTPISLWPPLLSPQSSSSQMLSHFPGGPPPHFPFYEMNPLLGGPIFAFDPQEDSSSTQSQPQKSTAPSSGSLGNWRYSGAESFYGPPAGYSGPFIGAPGGIPGVQGPSHMVLYNHFAPVGQYGQVGLSFMGATYIPSGKQTDWKNTPTCSGPTVGEGDINNMKMTNVQQNAPNTMAPVQHLAPGSPLLPIPSPLPMFDVSPFQTATDLSVQARWGHVPATSLHSIPVSQPLQPQGEGALPSQVNHGHSMEQSLTANRFNETQTPAPSDEGLPVTVAADKNVTPLHAELGLVASLGSTTALSVQSVAVQSSSGSVDAGSRKNDTIENGKHQNASCVKTQFSQKNASIQQGNKAGDSYKRDGPSQRTNKGNERSHRRMGFHGRNHSRGVDKGFPASKMKQIYVAKQIGTGSSAT